MEFAQQTQRGSGASEVELFDRTEMFLKAEVNNSRSPSSFPESMLGKC